MQGQPNWIWRNCLISKVYFSLSFTHFFNKHYLNTYYAFGNILDPCSDRGLILSQRAYLLDNKQIQTYNIM